jgi:hypothetical protein
MPRPLPIARARETLFDRAAFDIDAEAALGSYSFCG